jgi:flagellar hook-associated protein 2
VSDLIPGVTLDLHGGGDSVVSVAADPSSLVSKIHSLVASYNGVATVLTQQSTYDGTVKGADTLFGDPLVSNLQNALGSILTAAHAHGSGQTSLALLGVSLGSDGTLSVDDAKLSAALAADPTVAQDLFTGEGGLAGELAVLANDYTSTQGPLFTREDSLRTLMKSYDDQISQINDRADQYQTQLQNQFASLTSLLSAYEGDSSYLSALTGTTTTK